MDKALPSKTIVAAALRTVWALALGVRLAMVYPLQWLSCGGRVEFFGACSCVTSVTRVWIVIRCELLGCDRAHDTCHNLGVRPFHANRM